MAAACSLLAGEWAVAACGHDLKAPRLLKSGTVELAYAPTAAPIARGKPFSLLVMVCAPDAATASLRADARMPEHGHGMGYAARAYPDGPGRWRVDGYMLHMAGRWELQFEVDRGGRVERLVDSLQLP